MKIMNKRQKKKLNKRLHTNISVIKKEPPIEKWITGNLSNGGRGYPIYIERDGRMFYKTLDGRVEIDKSVKLLSWRMKF